MIWPPSKPTSMRTDSVSATGNHLREDAVGGVGMQERDLQAEEPLRGRSSISSAPAAVSCSSATATSETS